MQRMVCMRLWNSTGGMKLWLVDVEKTLIAIMFLASVDIDKYNGINKITFYFFYSWDFIPTTRLVQHASLKSLTEEPHWRVKDFIFLNLSLIVAHRLFGSSKCCSIKALWACSVRFMWSRVRPYLPTGVNGPVLIASHHRLNLLSCWMLVLLCGCTAD